MHSVRNRHCAFITTVIVIVGTVRGWPDGAPCLRNTLESMSPLEAEEHQGGLQLTQPPYEITLDTSCYRSREPIRVTLTAKNGTTFKGFALQARVYEGEERESTRRIGEFFREDNNAAWRFQCFRYRDGITHSYPKPKTKIAFTWQVDEDDGRNVQFVATVVQHVKSFWLRSVVSEPIPPCSFASHFGQFVPRPITAPPPIKRTKFGFLTNFHSESAPERVPIDIKPETIIKPTPPPLILPPSPSPSPPPPSSPPPPPPRPATFPATFPTTSLITLPPPTRPVRLPIQNRFNPNSRSNLLPQQPPPLQQQTINNPTFRPLDARQEFRRAIVSPNPESRPINPRPDFRVGTNPFGQNRFIAPQQTFVQQPLPRRSFERVIQPQPIIRPQAVPPRPIVRPQPTPPPVPATQPFISRTTTVSSSCQDFAPACLGWQEHCATNSNMRQVCPRTCQTC